MRSSTASPRTPFPPSRLPVAFVLLLAAAGCAGNRTTVVTERPGGPMVVTAGAATQERTVMNIVAAFNAHDAPRMASFYAPAAVVGGPGPKGWSEQTGRDPIVKGHQGLFAGFPDVKMIPVRLIQSGSVVVQEWVTTGHSRGESLGGSADVQARGKPMGLKALTIYWIDDAGLVKRDHTYLDSLTLTVQIGARPGRARPPLAAPSRGVERIAGQDKNVEEKNTQLVRRYVSALERKSQAELARLLHPRVELERAEEVTDVAGRSRLLGLLQEEAREFPDAKLALQNVIAVGNLVVAELTLVGTHRQTRKPVTLHRAEIFRIVGESIDHISRYANRMERMGQLDERR